MEELWADVDRYVSDLFSLSDDVLQATLKASDAEGLPAIQVSAPQGKLLQLLATAMGARSILEVGTLGGYSTICLARGLSDGGRVVSLEANQKHADVARANIENAGLSDVVEVVVGDASQTMQTLIDEGRGPFDMIFIDADKTGYTRYLELSLRLSRVGTLIVADNVVRDGAVLDPASEDLNVQAVRKFNAALANESRASSTVLQMVGAKGYDGMAIAVVVS